MKLERADIKGLLVVCILVVISVTLITLSLPYLTSDKFVNYLEGIHPFGPLVIILFTVISQVFAPMPGSPGVVVSLAVFGWSKTRFYVYIASLISATISFYISRKFGRNWVRKLVGARSMNEVDLFAKEEGSKVLIAGRLLGFSLFDYISYAAGLTTIPYKTYIIITAIFTGISHFGFMYIFRNLDFTTPKGFLIWYGSIILLFPIFTYMIKRYMDIRRSNREKRSIL